MMMSNLNCTTAKLSRKCLQFLISEKTNFSSTAFQTNFKTAIFTFINVYNRKVFVF